MSLTRTFKKAGKTIGKSVRGAKKAIAKQTELSAGDAVQAGTRVIVETRTAARRAITATDALAGQVENLVHQNMRVSPEALIDIVLGAFGIQIDKMLRLRICILRTERGVPVAEEEDVRLALA